MSSYVVEPTDDKHKIDHSEYGVVANGFRRKTFAEAMADRIERAKLVFGVNVDTSSTSMFGKLIRNAAWDEVAIYEKMEDIYYSPFVNFSSGSSLDGVGQYLTITRRPATKSNGVVTIYGKAGTEIPKGFILSSENGVLFETTKMAVIKGDGKVDVEVISIGSGRNQNVTDGKINKIQNPMYGVDRVENLDKTEGGLDQETDDEFRERYKKSYSRVGGSTVPAITAALLDINEVVDCEVRENVTMVEVDGIPPKSFECYVFGGKDDDIVKAIYCLLYTSPSPRDS